MLYQTEESTSQTAEESKNVVDVVTIIRRTRENNGRNVMIFNYTFKRYKDVQLVHLYYLCLYSDLEDRG